MHANPALTEMMRAVLLTEELLGLPGKVAELTQAQVKTEARLEELTQAQVKTEARLAELTKTVSELSKTVSELSKTVSELVQAQQSTETTVQALLNDVSRLKGSDFENRWLKDAPSYLGHLGFRRTKVLERSELVDILDDALDQGLLNQAERDDTLLVDCAHLSMKDKERIIILTEVSSRAHKDDAERVLRRANSLGKAQPGKVVACVAGAEIDSETTAFCSEHDIFYIQPSTWR